MSTREQRIQVFNDTQAWIAHDAYISVLGCQVCTD